LKVLLFDRATGREDKIDKTVFLETHTKRERMSLNDNLIQKHVLSFLRS